MIKSLQKRLNQEVNMHFDDLQKLYGTPRKSFMPKCLAIRKEIPTYPFRLNERDNIYPPNELDFGGCIFKGRKQGINEIVKSFDYIDHEHSWLFIPSENLWIDDTLDYEHFKSRYASVSPDHFISIFLSYIFDEVEIFHTHPDSIVFDLFNDSYTDKQNALIRGLQPSHEDLISYMQVSATSSENCQYVGSIISHFGVLSYKYNSLGLKSKSIKNHNGAYYHIGDMLDPCLAIENAVKHLQEGYFIDSERYYNDGTIESVFDFTFEPHDSNFYK